MSENTNLTKFDKNQALRQLVEWAVEKESYTFILYVPKI